MPKKSTSPVRMAEKPKHRRLWSVVIGLLITVGSLSLGAFALAYWAERQVLTTDNWVAMVGPLPKQPVVSTALGSYITERVFDADAVKQRVEEALPPRAVFLSGPLTSQLETLTTRTAETVVASDGFQSIWIGANRIAIDRLVTTARDPSQTLGARVNERFNLNLSEVRDKVRSVLGDTSAAVPGLSSTAQSAITITTDLKTSAEKLRSYVRSIDLLAAVLPWLTAACLLWALALSWRRRRTALIIAVTVVVVMLIEIIAIKWLRQSVLTQVRADAAIGYIFDVASSWLIRMITIVIVVASLLYLVLLALGPSQWAKKLQSFIRIDRLERSRVGTWWRVARTWVSRYEYYIWGGIGIVTLAGVTLLTTPSTQVILSALLMMLSLFAILHILADIPSRPARRTSEGN